jgi:hypothetical protein
MGYWNGLMYYWADPIGSTHLIGSGICIGLTKINQPTLWHLHFYFYFLKKKIWKLGRAWVKKSYPNLMTRKQLTLTRKTLAPCATTLLFTHHCTFTSMWTVPVCAVALMVAQGLYKETVCVQKSGFHENAKYASQANLGFHKNKVSWFSRTAWQTCFKTILNFLDVCCFT